MMGEIATDLGDRDIRTVPSLDNGWKEGVLNNPRLCKEQVDYERPQFWNTSLESLKTQAFEHKDEDSLGGFNASHDWLQYHPATQPSIMLWRWK